MRNGKEIHRIGVRKDKEGITVNNHSMLLYFGTLPSRAGFISQVSSTINDPTVLQEYHDILIPKAVEYSAGILDYFFRGQLALSIEPGTNIGLYVIGITNISSQDFKDGSFTLLKQDAAGTREIVTNFNISGTLATGSRVDIPYADSSLTTNTQFFVVYKGTIGITSGSASDPVDAGIAIAAKKFGVYANPEFIYDQCTGSDGEGGYAYNHITIPAGVAYSPISEDDAINVAVFTWVWPRYPSPPGECL